MDTKRILSGFICILLPCILSAQCETFFGKLVINEVMASNSSVASDEMGEFDDLVELHNATDTAINLQGYFLSDDHGTRTKFAFPDVEIAPHGYLVIWCDGQPEQGPLHTSFGISANGEEIGLYDSDTNAVDYVRFQEIPTDITIGRYPNGTGPYARLIPTVGSENSNSVQPGIVINEYMAANTNTAFDQYGGAEDWVELYNNSEEAINLQGYFLSDKIGEPTMYQFPDTILNPDSYLIIWADQGLMEPGLHTFFKLGADGDDIILSAPDTSTIDYVRFELQFEDVSEGRFPNGTGAFLCPPNSFSESNGNPTTVSITNPDADLSIYPNPASDVLNCINLENQEKEVQIIDYTGKVVEQLVLTPGHNRIGVQNLRSGLYFLRSDTNVQKFIVFK